MNLHDRHGSCIPTTGLPPVSGSDPRILILGSFPSQKSLAWGQYYGNPRNHFWSIMEALFTIRMDLPYASRIRQVTEHGIALWDVVGSCSRPTSADARIAGPVFNDIAGFTAAHPGLQLIVLNGSTAGRFYRKIGTGIPVTSVILPSTSPANAAMSIDEKVRRWSALLGQR